MKKEKVDLNNIEDISGGTKGLLGNGYCIDGFIKKEKPIVAIKSPRGEFIITNKDRYESGAYVIDARYDLGTNYLVKRGININRAEIIESDN